MCVLRTGDHNSASGCSQGQHGDFHTTSQFSQENCHPEAGCWPCGESEASTLKKFFKFVFIQVALKFSSAFWRDTVGNADFFGHIASCRSQRGMFGVFYDLSSRATPTTPPFNSHAGPPPKLLAHILVTTVSGEALVEYEKMSDMEIVERCVGVLRCMFPSQQVPAPIGHVVSRWGADPFAQMSYSYAAVGSGGEDYDVLAEDVEGRIFFAGEVSRTVSLIIDLVCLFVCCCCVQATNRQHPQTVTGAYLSGVREASKIIALSSS